MLIASRDGARVEAQSAERHVPYHCPGCDCPVVLKRGAVITAHFAHRAKSSCGYASRETETHRSAKLAIFQAFRASGLRAELEHYVPSLDGNGDRRADVMVWLPSGQRVAIEVQHSAISMDDLHRRSASYAAAGIAFCWVPVINQKLINAGRAQDDGDLVLKRYAAPHWQRWINGVGFGRFWLMTSDLRLWDARLKPSIVNLPGGQERVLSTVKDLHLVPIDLATIKLSVEYRQSFEGGEHRYPAGYIGKITGRRLPIPPVTVAALPEVGTSTSMYRGHHVYRTI